MADKKTDKSAAAAPPDRASPKAGQPTIEEHAATAGTPAWVLAGTKVQQDWAAEQRVSRAEYDKAVRAFLGGPTHPKGAK